MRSFPIFWNSNNLVILGIGGKYHITFARTLFFFLVFVLFDFHLEIPQTGHEDASFNSFIYNMKSLGQAFIFSYFIHNAFNVFFPSFIDNDNSLFTDDISPRIFKCFEKLLSDHPYRAFKLYSLSNVDNFVNFLQPRNKGFEHLQVMFQTFLGYFDNHHIQLEPFLLYYPHC